MYGMTYDDYWHGDPMMASAYREAYIMKQKKENEMMWINGMYTLNAFSVVMANAFREKGKPAVEYLSKPIELFPKTKQEKEQEAEEERKKIADMFTLWGQRFKAQHET